MKRWGEDRETTAGRNQICVHAGIVACKWGAYWLTPQCTPECLFLSKLKEEKRGEESRSEDRSGEQSKEKE